LGKKLTGNLPLTTGVLWGWR